MWFPHISLGCFHRTAVLLLLLEFHCQPLRVKLAVTQDIYICRFNFWEVPAGLKRLHLCSFCITPEYSHMTALPNICNHEAFPKSEIPQTVPTFHLTNLIVFLSDLGPVYQARPVHWNHLGALVKNIKYLFFVPLQRC